MLTEDFRHKYAALIEDGTLLNVLTMIEIAINLSDTNLNAERDSQNYYLILTPKTGEYGNKLGARSIANKILELVNNELPKMYLRDGDLEFEKFWYPRSFSYD